MSDADATATGTGTGPFAADLSSRALIGLVVLALLALLTVAGVAFPDTVAGDLLRILASENTLASALRLAVPIALAALGGIFAEKSGVINIGLEGLLIISAFTAVYVTDLTRTAGEFPWWAPAAGVAAGVVASTLLAALFAVVCIRYKADQIIAGLAVWLIALGLAPFASQVVYGRPNTPSVPNPPSLGGLLADVPGLALVVEPLAAVPYLGVLVEASLTVHLMLAMVVVAWFLLNRTAFGRHVRASGENPRALDTVGVDVSRVRYAAVLLSGVLAGMGGAALSMDLGQFTGNGPTMVNGKGFIAIVAYLFGNYNPVGTFLSTLLFAGLDALQVNLQIVDVGVPNSLVRTVPFVTVIVVLALVGRTRIPEAAGEHYESGEE